MAKKAKKRRSRPRPQTRKSQPAGKASTAPPARTKPTKAERIEAARRARRRKTLMVRAALVAIAALIVVGVAARVISGRKESGDTRRQLTAGSCTFDTRADPTDPSPANHVPNPTYRVEPPAGGNHSPQAAPPKTYAEDQVPADGLLVHALEHGYVILWHRPDLSREDRASVQEVADRHERDVLVVPRPQLPTPVAATAWGNRLLCRATEADALDLFTREYGNKGPERVPHD